MNNPATIKAYWLELPAPIANVGDALTPWILAKYGLTAVNSRTGSLYGAGSILPFARPGCTVIGTGSFGPWRAPDGVAVLALRGPLTAQAPQYGDFGLLAAKFSTPAVGGGGVKFVPHHRVPDALIKLPPDMTLLSPRLPVDEFLDGLRTADTVVSQSLHGCVLADALGVPNAPQIKAGSDPRIAFRFKDYYAGIGADYAAWETIAEAAEHTVTHNVLDVAVDLDETLRGFLGVN